MLGNNNLPLAGGSLGGAKVPPLIREFVQSLDDKEWQTALFGLLQNQVRIGGAQLSYGTTRSISFAFPI